MRTNNIFRKIVKSLHLETTHIQALFALADIELSDKEVANLLKTDYEPGFEAMPEYILIIFLDKLIERERGKKSDTAEPVVEKHAKISNNDVLKKLRIAFVLHEQDLRDALKLVTIELTKSDLAALFRKAGHEHYKACDDELVLDFIEGIGVLLQQKKTGV